MSRFCECKRGGEAIGSILRSAREAVAEESYCTDRFNRQGRIMHIRDWRFKAFLLQMFSHMPWGEQAYYFCQRWVTKTLPSDEYHFLQSTAKALEHIKAIQQHFRRAMAEATFYEFGAGWDMLIPLTFYALGVERQVVIDIRTLLRHRLVNATVEKYGRVSLGFPIQRRPTMSIGSGTEGIASLKRYYGIEYLSPYDASNTGLAARSIDCITSTDTLEHIPVRDIPGVFEECHRVLKEDGLMSLRIDYRDHYALFEPRVSYYNFLRYSDEDWVLFNPRFHYQNRLRHRDYLELLSAAGFSVIREMTEGGTERDMEILRGMPLWGRFKNEYTMEELAIQRSLLLLRKADARRERRVLTSDTLIGGEGTTRGIVARP